MALFICTGGTSIAEGGPLRTGESLDDFRARIDKKIASAQANAPCDPLRLLVRLSAETNGLARADCGPGDEVLVLATDTPDGLAAAEAVIRVVAETLGATGRVRGIAGLQVSEATSFRQSGIRNLIEIVLSEVGAARANGPEQVVFNVTGGFKGVVPYLTLLGMLNEIETIYVYDNSEVLIRLPPLPLRFDHERIAFALPALRQLRNAIMEEEKLRRLLPGRGWHDDPVLKDLIEAADGLVALSAAGELALHGLDARRQTCTVKLHRNAQRSPMLDHEKAVRALQYMTVPESFEIPTHSWEMPAKTDMLIWKTPKGPAAPRLFYWRDGEEVYVAEILHHEEYYDEIVHGSRRIWMKDYNTADFVTHVAPFFRSDPLADALSEWISELDDERAEMEGQVVDLQRQTGELQVRIADANRRRERLEVRLGEQERELTALRAERDRLAAQSASDAGEAQQ